MGTARGSQVKAWSWWGSKFYRHGEWGEALTHTGRAAARAQAAAVLGSARVLGDQKFRAKLSRLGGHCKVFGFCINEKEATGAFEQGRDKTVYVLKGLSGCCIEYKLWSPGWKQESHYEAVVRILVMVTWWGRNWTMGHVLGTFEKYSTRICWGVGHGIQGKEDSHECHPGFGLSKFSFNVVGKLGEQVWAGVMVRSWGFWTCF